MTTPVEEFIEEARAVTIDEAAERLGLKFTGRRHEHPQPCPVCSGRDTFSFNTEKNKWNCRHGGVGGQDAIGMAAHILELDVRRRAGFLEACSAVLGRDIPAGGERETDEERAARHARLEELRLRHYQEMAEREAGQNAFRDRERQKAQGIVQHAAALRTSAMCEGRFYLQRRGCGIPDDEWLRIAPDLPYWHGTDDRGQPLEIYSGAAMVAPFIDPAGEVIGCHITWIDLAAAPKFRPVLFGLTRKGAEAGRAPWRAGDRWPSREDIDAEFFEPLATKKMRGTKKGGVIPLAGSPSARRWLGAEGIENTLAFARWEEFRPDTFYFAAGDLGNMAGPADPSSRRAHPTLRKKDKNGRERAVMVQGPVPLFRDAGEPDAMVVPDHVDELVLIGDGDSEPVMTASAMVRAKARHARPGRLVPIIMPRRGTDFAAMLAGHPSAFSYDDEVKA